MVYHTYNSVLACPCVVPQGFTTRMEMDDNDNFVDVSYIDIIYLPSDCWILLDVLLRLRNQEESNEKQTFFSVGLVL